MKVAVVTGAGTGMGRGYVGADGKPAIMFLAGEGQ